MLSRLTPAKALALVLALALAWPLVANVRNALSDLYAGPAIDYLKDKPGFYELSDAEWQAVEQNVSQAAQLMPGNPAYFETLGQLHQIKLTQNTDDLSIEQMSAHIRAAADYYSRAISARPTWPYYWGNLALEEYRRGNYTSPEYNGALANAARFGPWKKDVQRLVADLGSETWDFLEPDTRRELLGSIERGLEAQPSRTVVIVRLHDAWPVICDFVLGSDSVELNLTRTLCENALAGS